MRIAHIITGLRGGGAEMMLYRLVKTHHDMGIDSIVYSLSSDGKLKPLFELSGYKVIDLDFSSKKLNVCGIIRLKKELEKYKPDLVQCWMYHANFFGLIANMLAGKFPVVWNIRNSTLSPKNSSKKTIFIMKVCGLLSTFPDRIISCSFDAKRIHIRNGYKEDKFTIIPNGIDTSLFLPDIQMGDELRTKLGIGASDFVVGVTGRYDPQKDYPNLIHAARILSAKKTNIHYVLCGSHIDKENLKLMQMIKEFELQDKMHLLGYQSRMHEIYPIMDVFVSTSAYGEAFPNVIAEAMACGVPCVSTDVGDAAYIIGETGSIVSIGNSKAIADAVDDILSSSVDYLITLKQAARNRIVENFSLPKIAQQYKDTYTDIINRAV